MTQGAARARPQRRRVRRARSTTARCRRSARCRARSAASPTGTADDGAALLVVGSVAGLREHLRWFDDRPLFGRRIVVTRSREQAGELVEMLEDRGAEAILAPTIRILPPDDLDALDRACADAGTFDWIIFTSANGVDHFMERLLAIGDIRDLKGVRLCTVGSSTAARLQRFGIRIDLTPSEYPQRGGRRSCSRISGRSTGVRILLPRADIARERLGDELRRGGRRRGRSRRLQDGDRRRRARGRGPLPHAARSPDRRGDVHQRVDRPQLRRRSSDRTRRPTCCAARSSPASARSPPKRRSSLDITTTVMPERYTIPDLVDALVEHFGKQ